MAFLGAIRGEPTQAATQSNSSQKPKAPTDAAGLRRGGEERGRDPALGKGSRGWAVVRAAGLEREPAAGTRAATTGQPGCWKWAQLQGRATNAGNCDKRAQWGLRRRAGISSGRTRASLAPAPAPPGNRNAEQPRPASPNSPRPARDTLVALPRCLSWNCSGLGRREKPSRWPRWPAEPRRDPHGWGDPSHHRAPRGRTATGKNRGRVPEPSALLRRGRWQQVPPLNGAEANEPPAPHGLQPSLRPAPGPAPPSPASHPQERTWEWLPSLGTFPSHTDAVFHHDSAQAAQRFHFFSVNLSFFCPFTPVLELSAAIAGENHCVCRMGPPPPSPAPASLLGREPPTAMAAPGSSAPIRSGAGARCQSMVPQPEHGATARARCQSWSMVPELDAAARCHSTVPVPEHGAAAGALSLIGSASRAVQVGNGAALRWQIPHKGLSESVAPTSSGAFRNQTNKLTLGLAAPGLIGRSYQASDGKLLFE